MEKVNYKLSKKKLMSEKVDFEREVFVGYQVNPRVKKKNDIMVNKIIFVNDNMGEKVIRKKIDKKINYLLRQLELYDEDATGNGNLEKDLVIAEKLKMQIINTYVKYLGNTYECLTLDKIEIIINELRYRMNVVANLKNNYYGGRGR